MVAAGLYEWLMLFHVLAAMVWIGGGVTLLVMATGALRDGQPEAIGRFVGSLRVIGPRVFAPAVILVLGLGVWMVLQSDEWDFGQFWIRLALGLFVMAFLIGVVYMSRTAMLAGRAVAREDHLEAKRRLRNWVWGYGAIILILVITTWDMVFKPGM
jgi:uncharacterized membrane protein